MENAQLAVDNRTKKFVEKNDMKKLKQQMDKQIENLFALIQARMAAHTEGDNAILSKKPLGGWSCASCEKHLTNLIN